MPAEQGGVSKPRLLDLFCGAGGAARGYQLAGFHVTGVDIAPQPRYAGDEFIQADALTFPLDGFDSIHASPPCQDHTEMPNVPDHGTGWMLAATIDRLRRSGRPFVVENVPGAARSTTRDWYLLCGKSFGLAPLKRHRLFLTNFPMLVPPCSCNHLRDRVVGIYGDLRAKDRRASRTRPALRASVDTARRLLGCPWMDGKELSQAIPPAYTQFIGEQLMREFAAVSP
jgi:DNA (cytosine-5)-methyltransferase 1